MSWSVSHMPSTACLTVLPHGQKCPTLGRYSSTHVAPRMQSSGAHSRTPRRFQAVTRAWHVLPLEDVSPWQARAVQTTEMLFRAARCVPVLHATGRGFRDVLVLPFERNVWCSALAGSNGPTIDTLIMIEKIKIVWMEFMRNWSDWLCQTRLHQ